MHGEANEAHTQGHTESLIITSIEEYASQREAVVLTTSGHRCTADPRSAPLLTLFPSYMVTSGPVRKLPSLSHGLELASMEL
jgi:hypothetical protein